MKAVAMLGRNFQRENLDPARVTSQHLVCVLCFRQLQSDRFLLFPTPLKVSALFAIGHTLNRKVRPYCHWTGR